MASRFLKSFSFWSQIIIGVSLAILGFKASAQTQESRFTLEYPMTVPYGETKDFIDETSYQGMGFSSFFPTADSNLSWGFSFQWIGWDESDNMTSYQTDGATITGSEDREMNVYPLMVQARYEFPLLNHFTPYVGLGAGAAYVEQYQRLGFIANDDYATQGVISPEAGAYFELQNIALGFGLQYLSSFTNSDPADLNGLTIRLALGFSTK